MPAYKCDLEKGQQVYIENQEAQTIITLTSGGPDQQQSQGNSFDTGNCISNAKQRSVAD